MKKKILSLMRKLKICFHKDNKIITSLILRDPDLARGTTLVTALETVYECKMCGTRYVKEYKFYEEQDVSQSVANRLIKMYNDTNNKLSFRKILAKDDFKRRYGL